ncbi:MAG: hypothetical protein ACR2NP_09815 [Pirellulaceae bacterium]
MFNTSNRIGSPLLSRICLGLLTTIIGFSCQAGTLSAQDSPPPCRDLNDTECYSMVTLECRGPADAAIMALALYHGIDIGVYQDAMDLSGHGTTQNWGEYCYSSYNGGQSSTYSSKGGGGRRN